MLYVYHNAHINNKNHLEEEEGEKREEGRGEGRRRGGGGEDMTYPEACIAVHEVVYARGKDELLQSSTNHLRDIM